MDGIIGAGLYVPFWRIELAEITKAWGGDRLLGEISVAGPDEDVFTMALMAARDALGNCGVQPAEIGIVAVCTVSHSKFPLAARLAYALGAKSDARVWDLGLTTRSTTQGLLACLDALQSGSTRYGVVVGVDSPLPEPGSSDEMSCGAAAGAVVLGPANTAFSAEGSRSYSTAFTERWKVLGKKFQRQTAFPRFARDTGYVHHVCSAVSSLFDDLSITIDGLKLVILQESSSADRAAKTLRIPQEKLLRGESGMFFGDTGCAALLLSLIEGSRKVKAGDMLLLASYGVGGSDAICLAAERPENLDTAYHKLTQFRDHKSLIDYPSLLRYRGIIGWPE
jgi:3-hydroxy-3-methylglutaryl CoA synthase